MKLSHLNDYLQSLATIGAIIGLMLVGYEVRQSNAIAVSQTTSANWTNWLDTANSRIDSGIAATIAKSMTHPDELSLEEKINLSFFLESWLYQYEHDLSSLYFLDAGVFEETEKMVADEVTIEAPRIFGSRFSRAWLQKNRHWISPPFLEVLDAALEGVPVGSGQAYWKSIDELAANME